MLRWTGPRLLFDVQCELWHFSTQLWILSGILRCRECDNSFFVCELIALASESELTEFLKSVEKRAFKRSVYHVRNEESALDIVQESMMKLAEHYGHKPIAELPMLFQRILSNCTLDWFRRQKVQHALFSNMSDFESANEEALPNGHKPCKALRRRFNISLRVNGKLS
jgi:DNA-directed RNA polymerase specialized sigma24 family protein